MVTQHQQQCGNVISQQQWQCGRWCWGERKGRFEPQPDIKIERRVERQVIIISILIIILVIIITITIHITSIMISIISRQESEQGSLGERTLPLTQGLGEATITSITSIIFTFGLILVIFVSYKHNPASKRRTVWEVCFKYLK